MSNPAATLVQFFSQNKRVIKLELLDVKGSSPREAGTIMYVAQTALWGTIGGGQLEFMLIERAREMLMAGVLADCMDIPLGPEIGQCCGGRVQVRLARIGAREKEAAFENFHIEQAQLPHVYILGAGHVGRALADLFQHLPVRCILIDTRENELMQCTANVETRLSAIPEVDIQNAPKGSAFIVLTHDHGLDFLLTSAALAKNDAAYVGMIGSATKRAKLASWCREMCDNLSIQNLICPIGAAGSRDKRPSVIAAFVVAEVTAELTRESDVKDAQKDFVLQECKQLTGRKAEGAGKTLAASRPTGGGTHNDRPELYL